MFSYMLSVHDYAQVFDFTLLLFGYPLITAKRTQVTHPWLE